jgi:hypothetical protein
VAQTWEPPGPRVTYRPDLQPIPFLD